MILETIDLNGIQTLYALSNRLDLNDVLPNKVTIWKLRNNNPLRKSYLNNNIKLIEFEALTKITVGEILIRDLSSWLERGLM